MRGGCRGRRAASEPPASAARGRQPGGSPGEAYRPVPRRGPAVRLAACDVLVRHIDDGRCGPTTGPTSPPPAVSPPTSRCRASAAEHQRHRPPTVAVRGLHLRSARLGPRRRLLPGLPGPVRLERPGPQAGPARALGRARRRSMATRVETSRPRRAARRAGRSRDQRDLPEPDLQRRLQPPLQRLRLHVRRSVAGRRRRAPRAPRRSPRPRNPDHPRRGLQPRRSGFLAVPPRPRGGRRIAVSRVVLPRSRHPRPSRGLGAYDDGRDGSHPANSATGCGGTSRHSRNCGSSTRRYASTCSASPSTGSASGSTGGGSTSPTRSRTRRSGRNSASRVRAVNPEAYICGEIWEEAPDWLTGDRFDALMNYPLTMAVLGFIGGDRNRPRDHRRAGELSPRAGAPRRTGIRRTAGTPDVVPGSRRDRLPVQSSRQPRHAPGTDRHGRRSGAPTAGDAPPADATGCSVDLLRGRARDGRGDRPGLPARLPAGRSRGGSGSRSDLGTHQGGHSRAQGSPGTSTRRGPRRRGG